MAYNGHNWVNDGPPAINATNLNEMDNELELLDGANDSTISILKELNSYNLIEGLNKNGKASSGLVWKWDGDVLSVSGTATGNTYYVIYSNPNQMPNGFVAGKKYKILHETSNMRTQIYYYNASGSTKLYDTGESGEFVLPADTIGMIIRFWVSSGVSINESVVPIIIDAEKKSNKELTEDVEKIYPTKGVLDDGVSCNDVTEYGVYFISASRVYLNWAFGDRPGWLFVYPDQINESFIIQIAFRYGPLKKANSCLYRTKQTSGWTEWSELSESYLRNIAINSIFEFGSYELTEMTNGTSGSSGEVTYTKNSNQSWTINGTASGLSYRNILQYNTELPDKVIPGRSFQAKISQDSAAFLEVFIYQNGTQIEYKVLEKEDTFTLPENATGFIVRFRVSSGQTVDNQTVSVSIVAIPEFSGEQTIINNTIHNDTFNNEYNISVSPQITTDKNGWLQAVDTDTEDESGKTDMTSAIMAMLEQTGYCHLGQGIFYVSGNIDMPEGSMIEGCGYDTDVRLLSSVTEGYVFKMEKYNTIKNLKVSGSYNPIPYSSFTHDKGTRHGIIFNSRYKEGTRETEYCTINNLYAINFTGCGIKCYNTSIATQRGLYVSQADIKRCQTGLFVDKYSEFNKFVQINTRYCYIGCENDGGNNMFIGCTFHSTNTGFLIDNSLSDKANNAHGSVIGCTFCHIGSNAGVAIAIKNTGNGFTFSDCQVWYNSIDIEDSYGITFSNMEFGRGVPIDVQSAKGATINVKGGGTVIFTGCIFMNDITYPPTITIQDNDKVKFNGCYGSHSGNPIVA